MVFLTSRWNLKVDGEEEEEGVRVRTVEATNARSSARTMEQGGEPRWGGGAGGYEDEMTTVGRKQDVCRRRTCVAYSLPLMTFPAHGTPHKRYIGCTRYRIASPGPNFKARLHDERDATATHSESSRQSSSSVTILGPVADSAAE